MTRELIEARNKRAIYLVRRRRVLPKRAARILGITWANLRQILHRAGHGHSP